MMEDTAQRKGLTDGISADRFYASVNGARAATGHTVAGVCLAWDLAARPAD
eukprot:gene32206-20108_t